MEIFYTLTYLTKKQIKIEIDNKFKKQLAIVNNKCFRCGQENIIEFCDNCSEFGRLTKNDVLYNLDKKIINKAYIKVEKELLFTPMQKQAANFINQCIIRKQDALIWAVCGAGKTEITFLAIEQVLIKKGYVCFAIPRIDILYEVQERLAWFFENIKVCILNSKEEKIQHGQIYVMTTNQLLKFKNAFDLIIIDEVDAFPYEHDPKFDYAANAAKTKNAVIVYLTSTPSENLKTKKLKTFIISRRWHGHLLPVPKYKMLNIKLFEKNIVPIGIHLIIKKLKRKQLWFVADIKKLLLIYECVSKIYKSYRFAFVYSSDENRREKVTGFNNNKYDILITTSILERGVTFDNIDVFVLDANSPLYNIAALVQISGRVGRKKEFQEGKVVFFHLGITDIMQKARKQIKFMNKQKEY